MYSTKEIVQSSLFSTLHTWYQTELAIIYKIKIEKFVCYESDTTEWCKPLQRKINICCYLTRVNYTCLLPRLAVT